MRITFTGDILCYKSQDKICKKSGYHAIFEKVKPILDASDYVVGSLETITAGKKAGYTSSDTSFNTPDTFLDSLKWAGFDLLTTANNHCLDRGEDGLKRTIEQIKARGLEYTGTRLSIDEQPYIIKDFDGTKVAFLSYTYGTNSKSNGCIIPKDKEYLVNLTRKQDTPIYRPWYKKIVKSIIPEILLPQHKAGIQLDCVSEIEVANGRNTDYEKSMLHVIENAKTKADIVIMCLHSGGQFNSKVGPYTQHLFKIIANAGADAIICNHAHKILPIYKDEGNCIVASALGNFSFVPGEGYYVENVGSEYSGLLHIDIVDAKITSVSTMRCKCIKNGKGLSKTTPIDDTLLSID